MRVASLVTLSLLIPLTALAALININTADVALLDSLPDIGPTKAQAIVDYRTQHGPFAHIEDIMNVTGIGPATFDKIKSLITVGESAPPAATSTPSTPLVAGAATYVPPPSTITLTIAGSRTALLRVPIIFTASVVSKAGADPSAQIVWSFGDGSAQTGTRVEKVYRYPGTYLVTARASDGAALASDELIVTAVAARLHLLTPTEEGVTIVSDSDDRIDLSAWRLRSEGGFFRIPEGTTLLPRASILFSSTITSLPFGSTVELLYPDSTEAARSPDTTLAAPALSMQPSTEVARSYSVQASRVTETPQNTESPITRSTNIQHGEAVLAPAAANDLATISVADLPG